MTGGSARGRRGQGRGISKHGVSPDSSDTLQEGYSSSSSEWSDHENAGVQQALDLTSDSGTVHVCPECGKEGDDSLWVQCDNRACEMWYHVECTNIDPEEYDHLSAITWFCNDCSLY